MGQIIKIDIGKNAKKSTNFLNQGPARLIAFPKDKLSTLNNLKLADELSESPAKKKNPHVLQDWGIISE